MYSYKIESAVMWRW